MKNMVDERFELAAMIFRIAGYPEYNSVWNDYQKEVAETFAEFANHETIEYTKNILSNYLGYDAVFLFSVHIKKKDDKFIFNENIVLSFDDRWDDGRAQTFLPLFNKFYVDTNYAEFYNSHLPYFERITQNFIDKTYGSIDFEWFKKYTDTNLRCIYSPSIEPGNYGASVGNNIHYSGVSADGYALVHEYCHMIGNPLGGKWYEENAEFKKWCDDSVDLKRLPAYNNGWIMGYEYCTRAYDILYKVQHGGDLEEALSAEKNHVSENTFPYIEDVYKMVLESEK